MTKRIEDTAYLTNPDDENENSRLMDKFMSLTFCDDYMFGALLNEYPDIAKRLLEEILNKKINRIEYPAVQKEIRPGYSAKGVRLDVYIDDGEESVYNIEMQNGRVDYLPKRSRYYQSSIDRELIRRGAKYTELKNAYVIFFCGFDPFGCQSYIYTFEETCKEENGLKLEDGTKKIFLSTVGNHGPVSEEMKNVLDYMYDTSNRKGSLVEDIDCGIVEIKKNENRRYEFMTLEEKMEEREELAEARGRKTGEEIGRKTGEEIGRKTGEEIGRKVGEEIGRKVGAHDKAVEMAQKCKAEGMANELISRVTGLTLPEVESL